MSVIGTRELRQLKERYQLLLLAADLVCAALAVALTERILRAYSVPAAEAPVLVLLPLLALLWSALLYLLGQYTLRPRQPGYLAVYQVFKAVLFGTCGALALSYLFIPAWLAHRAVYLLSALLFLVLASASRLAARAVLARSIFAERYLIVGAGSQAWRMVEAMSDGHAPPATELVGVVATSPDDLLAPHDDCPAPVLGNLEDLPELIDEHSVTHLVLCEEGAPSEAVMRAAAESEARGLKVQTMPSAFEALTKRAAILFAGTQWIARLETARRTKYATRLKRVVDVAICLLLLPIALVIVALAAIAIKLTSRGPVFYAHKRVGIEGRDFTFVKLRTMIQDAERDTGPVWATPDDPRITTVGRILRRLRLDEVPQLWSVLKGDMSLVGPRPERPHFVEQFRPQIPLYEKRLMVRPGITGWAQVNHPYDTCPEDVIEKLRYDLYYIRHISFSLDLQILVHTVGVMLSNRLVR